MSEETEKLIVLQTKMHEACKCGLKAMATQPVFGNGNPHAEIVFIGEAPGKDEDLQGIPFVGRAGQFLNTLLETIKLERSDVYITNTVKYRPPENRDPTPDEKLACREWLLAELNFIKPKIIVFLGRIAMSNFFPEAKISEVHGKLLVKQIAGFPTKYFFALYHPAAALYNGSMREVLEADFKKLPKAIEKIKEE
jgi:uracil-DNA glycosylase